MVTVYSRAANVFLYKSTTCSQATVFLAGLYAAVLILPALIVYHTHGIIHVCYIYIYIIADKTMLKVSYALFRQDG